MLTYEVNTNGGNIEFCISIIRESEQQAWLSYSGISNEEQFKKIVAERIKKRDKAGFLS